MKTALCSLIGGILVFVSQSAPAQTAPAGDCCTPEVTAKIAASAGFVDIVGIKPGMTPEQALAALKAANPALKIDVEKLPSNWDYLVMSAQGQLATDNTPDPKKRWVTGIQGTSPGNPAAANGYEEIHVGLTLPPNPQVVYGLSRKVFFPEKARPTVESVIAGLKKKYGPPSVEEVFGGLPRLTWIFDSQRQLIERSRAQKLITMENCYVAGISGGPDFRAYPLGQRGKFKAHGGAAECDGFVVVNAVVASPQIGGSIVSQMEVGISHWPLYISFVNATSALFDHTLKEREDKKLREAEKVGGPKF